MSKFNHFYLQVIVNIYKLYESLRNPAPGLYLTVVVKDSTKHHSISIEKLREFCDSIPTTLNSK